MEIFARGVGRRKEAVAQVQIVKGTGQFIINQIPAQQYLHHNTCSLLSVKGPLNALNSLYLSHLPESNSSTLVSHPSGGVDEHSSNNGTSSASSQKQAISLPLADPLLPKSSQSRELGGESPAEEQPFLDRFLAVGESQGVSSLKDDIFSKMDTIVKVKGGGLVGQAEAIRLGLARACCSLTTETTNLSLDEIRKQLKDKGYLTQDSRVKERRKYGLKKARKATQYNKR